VAPAADVGCRQCRRAPPRRPRQSDDATAVQFVDHFGRQILGECSRVRRRISGLSGSHTERRRREITGSGRHRLFGKGPWDRDGSISSTGVSTKNLDEFAFSTASRASMRSLRYGDMKRHQDDQPASTNSLATSRCGGFFHAVGFRETQVRGSVHDEHCRHRASSCGGPEPANCFSTMLAMVDLPAPDRPVNHSTAGFFAGSVRAAPACRRPGGANEHCCAPERMSVIIPAPTSHRQTIDQDEAPRCGCPDKSHRPPGETEKRRRGRFRSDAVRDPTSCNVSTSNRLVMS